MRGRHRTTSPWQRAALLPVVATLLLAACGGTSQDPRRDSPPSADLAAARAEVTALTERFTPAHVTGDSVTIDSMFTLDANAFPPGAPVARGNPAIHVLTMEFLKAGVHEFREESIRLQGSPTLLVDEGTYLLRYGTPAVTERGKYINVWTKADGRWRIRTNIWNTTP